MLNRRAFLGRGAAGSLSAALAAGPLAQLADAAASAPPARSAPDRAGERPRVPLHAVVFDERFAAARRFGAAARCEGLATHAIRGGVTRFWYSHLHPLWKRAPVPIAGLTAYGAMFCLERLCWDHGLRMSPLGAYAECVDFHSREGEGPRELAAALARLDPQRLLPCVSPRSGRPLHAWVILSPERRKPASA